MKLIALSAIAVVSADQSSDCSAVQQAVHTEGHAVLCPDFSNSDTDANAERRQQFVACFGNGSPNFTEEDILELCDQEKADRYVSAEVLTQSAMMTNLKSYGCWCNTASDWQIGRGQPVDGLDTACRNVHHSYRCLAAEGCDKDNLAWITAPEMVNGRLVWGCSVNDNGQTFPDPVQAGCAVKACTIGTHLYGSIMNLFMGGAGISPANVHIGTDFEQTDLLGNVVGTVPGEFDFDAECVAIPGERDVKCCGPYPFRREYDINTAECCAESGYEKIRSCGQCYAGDLVYPSEC